jgi:hypothetical protein
VQEEYEQWVALGRPEDMPPQRYIVIIRWPGDEDSGQEPYGPFPNSRIADQWVADCEEAARLGYKMLADAEYLIMPLARPFDPHNLMTDAATFSAAPPSDLAAGLDPMAIPPNRIGEADRLARRRADMEQW